jgi:inhibitor of KinA
MHTGIEFSNLGEQALLLRFKDVVPEEAHAKIITLHQLLSAKPFAGFVETIPAYDSIAILYDIRKIELNCDSFSDQIRAEIETYLSASQEIPTKGITHVIPVKYGGTQGPDLESVAKENNISPEELIRLHTERTYPVYMLGFSGGFPYLGFTHEKLFTARKAVPMQKVPAGSVALAGNQTGIYPFEGPGAWKIIGHTSYPVFDIHEKDPAIIKQGDLIKFVCD